MKLPVNKTSAEQKLIRRKWKNVAFSAREEKNSPYPRGVWFDPKGAGPFTLAVAILLTTTPEPDGQPFAASEDVASARRCERQQAAGERAAERLAVAADRTEAARVRREERALQ